MASIVEAEKSQLVLGFLPVDLQTGANTGDWVCLKGYRHVEVIFVSAVGTAGDDPTLTINQATAVAGTGSKALDFTTLYVKQAATDLTGTGTYTKISQTAANTYTEVTSAEQVALWIVEFDATDLDADNDFDCINATVADVGGNAQLGYLLYRLSGARHPQETAESAIID